MDGGGPECGPTFFGVGILIFLYFCQEIASDSDDAMEEDNTAQDMVDTPSSARGSGLRGKSS